MIKKILFPLFLIFCFSCNSPSPEKNAAKPKSHPKNKSVAPKPLPSMWKVMNYPGAEGDQTVKKYVRCEADGTYSNTSVTNDYVNADIIVDKMNAGILLHKSKKSNPSEKFTGPVHITMKSSSGNELELTSSRGWNKSGGIMIEKNNNDYSQFRIFMLQNEGVINVEIRDDSSSFYRFDINGSGFADAFGQI